MPFLYFPEDKTAYLPAAVTLVIFMAMASVTMYLFYKKSKKDEQAFNDKYEKSIHDAKESVEPK
ncbi:hypothetical protein [Oceanobacillus chungangensis]|uniref:Uncharacterized protein n=1 Tax=Oceanobacillus chungangensis TaxID=1229152 RepID=A0A3D8PY69_9BACI|nr:hypothetical protein [Oceanobacillus chungangensis]RDW20964.1 hypothetical protein CWR45_03710 [Oceanobacillus chungangensis]